MFLEVEEGGQDRDEEAVKVYLIRFIADLPLRLVYGLRETHNYESNNSCYIMYILFQIVGKGIKGRNHDAGLLITVGHRTLSDHPSYLSEGKNFGR